MDIHGILNYINSHWMLISMVYFPAAVGYLNAFVASARVMGWTKLADECGKLENAIQVFVATIKKQNSQPTTQPSEAPKS